MGLSFSFAVSCCWLVGACDAWCWPGNRSVVRGGPAVRAGGPGGEGCRCLCGRHVAALGADQVGQPPDLALDGLDAVPLELGGVAVDLGLGALQLALHAREALLQPRATALEDA